MEASRNPEITIILPCHDAASSLERAVASVQAQTFADFELLIVDDSSTDGSLACARRLAASDRRLRVLPLARNVGVGAARNRGIDAARGSYAAFLDADDEYLPGFLATLHDAAAAAPGTVAVCGHQVVLPDGGTAARTPPATLLPGAGAVRDAMRGRLTLFPWDKLVPLPLLEDLRFPEGPRRFEDLALLLAVYARSAQVSLVPEALVRYRISPGGLTWASAGSEADFQAARRHLEAHLAEEFRSGAFTGPYCAVLTLMRLLTAQTASVAADPYERSRAADAARLLPWRTVIPAVRAAPVIGAAGLLLKASPRLYGMLYGGYARRRYGIRAGAAAPAPATAGPRPRRRWRPRAAHRSAGRWRGTVPGLPG